MDFQAWIGLKQHRYFISLSHSGSRTNKNFLFFNQGLEWGIFVGFICICKWYQREVLLELRNLKGLKSQLSVNNFLISLSDKKQKRVWKKKFWTKITNTAEFALKKTDTNTNNVKGYRFNISPGGSLNIRLFNYVLIYFCIFILYLNFKPLLECQLCERKHDLVLMPGWAPTAVTLSCSVPECTLCEWKL